MKPTPRTDANTIAGSVILHNGQYTAHIVPSDFARKLETELTAMQARAEKAEVELAAESERVRVLREALEKYRYTVIAGGTNPAQDVLDATKEASK